MAARHHPHPNLQNEPIEFPEDSNDFDVVQIDAMVVLKIIKHCREHLPGLTTGQLLGLVVGRTLEVTNCFPVPDVRQDNDETDSDQDAKAEYQIEMMRCLREVNVDNNLVGWYQSAFLGSFFSDQMVKTQISYQLTIKKSVAIVYDPLRTSQGSLSLKAFRLSDSFVELHRSDSLNQGEMTVKPLTQTDLIKLNRPWSEIFEEVPIVIRNSNLVNACLYELEHSRLIDVNSTPFEVLDLSTNSFLEKNLESLIDTIDDLTKEQANFNYYQRNLAKQQAQIHAYRAKRKQARQAGEEEIPEEEDPTLAALLTKPLNQPDQLKTLLKTNQINNCCQQINQFSGQSFSKLFLLSGLNKE